MNEGYLDATNIGININDIEHFYIFNEGTCEGILTNELNLEPETKCSFWVFSNYRLT